mmetsp:Transcript_11865/g.13488  ORF Transcript_11865/g.13488 Transcript_11865/m.13488 type:complete len:146 (+) Transcript_11865:121-558(+)
MIVSTFIFSIVQAIVQVSRIINTDGSRYECSSYNNAMDMYCYLFRGQVNLYSMAYCTGTLILTFTGSIVGIYSWVRSFHLKTFEYYYYISSILTLFGYINTVILIGVQTEEVWMIFVLPLLYGFYYFHLLSVIYSVLLKKETEYR